MRAHATISDMRRGGFGWAALLVFGCSSEARIPAPANDQLSDGGKSLFRTPEDAGNTGPNGSSNQTRPGGGCVSDEGGCASLALCGDKIYTMAIASPAPPVTGGMFADGTYDLVTHSLYSGSGNGATSFVGPWFRETMRFSEGKIELASQSDQVGPNYYRGVVVPKGQKLNVTWACPDSEANWPYSADQDGLGFALFLADGYTVARYRRVSE